MKLILVRHGEAPPDPASDFSRELSERGLAQAQATAQYILPTYKPDKFIVSPLTRAQQTMTAFQTRAMTSLSKDVPLSIYDKIKPSDCEVQALRFLSTLEVECLLVVCHMDIIARMHTWLTGDSFMPFALAEARVYEQVAIAQGFGTQVDDFAPPQG